MTQHSTFINSFPLTTKLCSKSTKDSNKTLNIQPKCLGITDLHNDMILSTLSISSRGFTFDFSRKSRTNGDVFLIFKPMIILQISQCGTPSQQSSPRTKYTIEPLLRPIEPSNSLPLIETRLLLWSPQTKYTIELPLRPMEPSYSLPLIKAQLLLWSP